MDRIRFLFLGVCLQKLEGCDIEVEGDRGWISYESYDVEGGTIPEEMLKRGCLQHVSAVKYALNA